MLTHLGFSAWIVVDGKQLPEYLVAVDAQAHQVSCWIPSEEGQTFSVYWQDHGGQVDTCAFITLDGFVVPGRFLFGSGVAWRQGVRTGLSTERPFVFQKVEERQADISAPVMNKDLGMITLRIKRVERVASRPANPIQKIPDVRIGKQKIGGLRVGFGDNKQANDQFAYTWSVKAHDKDTQNTKQPSTYVSFVFRYRSREFLQSQAIIPEGEGTPVTPKRAPIRRIASAPATSIKPSEVQSTITPSTSSTKRKRKNSAFNFLRAGSDRLRRPSETRRTVSWKVSTTRPDVFPGQGLLRFDEDLAEKDIEDDPESGEAPAADNTKAMDIF